MKYKTTIGNQIYYNEAENARKAQNEFLHLAHGETITTETADLYVENNQRYADLIVEHDYYED